MDFVAWASCDSEGRNPLGSGLGVSSRFSVRQDRPEIFRARVAIPSVRVSVFRPYIDVLMRIIEGRVSQSPRFGSRCFVMKEHAEEIQYHVESQSPRFGSRCFVKKE